MSLRNTWKKKTKPVGYYKKYCGGRKRNHVKFQPQG